VKIAQLIKDFPSWVKVAVLLHCAQDLTSGPYPISLLLISYYPSSSTRSPKRFICFRFYY